MSKIVWTFIGDETVGSSRIHGYNIHEKLLELGYNSQVLYKPIKWLDSYIFSTIEKDFLKYFNEGDVFIVQKIKDVKYTKVLEELRLKKVHLVFIDCDTPIPLYYKDYFDTIICPSKFLVDLYKEKGFANVYCIEDCPEIFIEKSDVKEAKKCLWFGQYSDEKWKEVAYLNEQLKDSMWQLKTLSNSPKADFIWDKNAFKTISKFDAVLIPILEKDKESVKVKSSNRVLQSMALSVPVLAHQIPSYASVIKNEENGFLITNNNWKEALEKLANQEFKEAIIQNGFKTAKKFSLDKKITDWISALQLRESHKEKVTVKNLHPLQEKIYWLLLKKNKNYISNYKEVANTINIVKAYTYLWLNKVYTKFL